MSELSTVRIQRLRAEAPAHAAVAARLAIEALLGELTNALPGWPPQSVLMLRKLALTLPGSALTSWPNAGLSRRFGAGASAALCDAARSAARPARGGVASDCAAVVFADEAELLACLARDAAGNQLERWWWRLLLGSHHPDWTVAFARRPTALPAALRLLAKLGLEQSTRSALARRFVIEPAAVVTAPRTPPAQPAVARVHGPQAQLEGSVGRAPEAAPSALTAPDAAARAMLEACRGSVHSRSTGARAAAASQAAQATAPPPAAHCAWQRDVTQRMAAATDAQRPSMAADLTSSAVDVETARPSGETPASAATIGHALAARSSGQALSGEPRSATLLQPRPSPARDMEAEALPPTGGSTQDGRAATLSELVARTLLPPPKRLSPRAIQRASNSQGGTLRDATCHAQAPALAGSVYDWPPATRIEAIPTRFGGSFFLVNVFLAQGLYPDFTRPRDAGFPIPLWRLLALVSARLLGQKLREDPVWSLLLSLEPGSTPEDAPELDTLWAPPGGATVARRGDALGAWLDGFVRWLRKELSTALGWRPRDAPRRLLSANAQLWVTPAEVVVALALEQHPVEIRLAGLDRDPGFLPSAGCNLRFVFE